MRKRNSGGGRMATMLRAMNDYEARVRAQHDAPEQVTCPTCGAPVEPGALDKQTLPDGSLMWPAPMCWRCLMAGLERLDAELKRQPGKDGDA